MWYSDGAEREVVTGENGRRRRGAALCPSGAARRQGSDLQERRTGRRIQYARVLANGVIGGIAGMDRWQCSNPLQWSHVTVAPQWTGSRGERAIRRLGTWRHSSLRGREVLH